MKTPKHFPRRVHACTGGNMVRSDCGQVHVADVRGWGGLEKDLGSEAAAKEQDEWLEFIAEAVNEKLSKNEQGVVYLEDGVLPPKSKIDLSGVDEAIKAEWNSYENRIDDLVSNVILSGDFDSDLKEITVKVVHEHVSVQERPLQIVDLLYSKKRVIRSMIKYIRENRHLKNMEFPMLMDREAKIEIMEDLGVNVDGSATSVKLKKQYAPQLHDLQQRVCAQIYELETGKPLQKAQDPLKFLTKRFF